MGQDHSKESSHGNASPGSGYNESYKRATANPILEHLSSQLAQNFATKCFTPLELTHFKDNFRSLGETKDSIQYWNEDTLCRFLALPDALGAGPVVFSMASYLGAFPFPSLAPAILTREAMVKVVVLLTERYGKVLKRGMRDRNKLIFRALAVYDRQLSSENEKISGSAKATSEKSSAEQKDTTAPVQRHALGFAADIAGLDDDDDDDDELALAALDSLDVMDVYKTEHASEYKAQQAQIPIDNFRQLLLLLLVLAPLEPEEPLSSLADRVSDERIVRLKRIADSILWSFSPKRNPGIGFHAFTRIIDQSLPFLFEGLNPLFEHFLFSKNLDLHKHKVTTESIEQPAQKTSLVPAEPLIEEETEILSIETLSQISFFIPGASLFRRLRLLYSGDSAGFSINSISQKVINWRAPSILLVSGRRINLDSLSQHDKSFVDTIPHRTLPNSTAGNSEENRVVFGAYINVPWKQTSKEAIGDVKTTLFQLEPIHDVFQASTINRDYVTFNLSTGIGIGIPPSRSSLNTSSGETVVLGPVSLYLNDTLEYGVFTHDDSGGGAFGTSRSRTGSWRDIFEIDALEVWGCGGDEEAAKQREAWKWEEREAAARRGISLGTDKEATYALLEMAGIVGGASRTGGSMG